jgi:hypothetical protein
MRIFRRIPHLTLLLAVALLVPRAPAASTELRTMLRSSNARDPQCVAVIERRQSGEVIAREILTREQLERMVGERAGSFLVGFTEEERENLSEVVESNPRTSLEEERLEQERLRNAFFDDQLNEFLQTATVSEVADATDTESATDAEGALTATSGDPNEPPADVDPRLWRIMMSRDDDGEARVDQARRRTVRNFEKATIDEWIDLNLLALEARSRGHRATEAMVTEALLPMIQARRWQLTDQMRSAAENTETIIEQSDLAELDRTIAVIEQQRDGAVSPTVRQSVREEVEEILREEGSDPELFFEETEKRILADQLIQAALNEYISEESLRAYHARFTKDFIIPARFQYLSLKFINVYQPLSSSDRSARFFGNLTMLSPESLSELEQARDQFPRVQRRLRRIDTDVALDDVIRQWTEIKDSNADLPPRTYVSLSSFQMLEDIPIEIAAALAELAPGETSNVIESDRGVFIIRMVDILAPLGAEFEDVRDRVEERFYDEVRTRLLGTLRTDRYEVWMNRSGKPLSEVLADLNSPDAPPAAE